MEEVIPKRGVLFVERAVRSDEQDQSARANLVERGGEEIIMDEESPTFEPGIEGLLVSERDVGNGHIVEAGRQLGFLERLMPDVGVGI